MAAALTSAACTHLQGTAITDPVLGALRRVAAGNGWNDAGAVSASGFLSPVGNAAQPVIGVEFAPATDDQNFIVGLSASANPQPTYTTITYGIYLNSFRQVDHTDRI